MGRRTTISFALYALAATIAQTAIAETTPPPSVFGDLPAVEQVAISPSGKSLAMLTRINGQRQVGILEPGKGWRITAPIGELKVRHLAWAGEDIVLITKSDSVALGANFAAARYELADVIVLPLSGGNVRSVFNKVSGVASTVQGTYGSRLVDGRWVAYFGGIRKNVTRVPNADGGVTLLPDLMRIDLVSGDARSVARAAQQGHRRNWLVDESGGVGATFDINISTGKWTIANASGAVVATGTSPAGDAGMVSFGKNGDSVIYALDTLGDSKLLEIPLAGGSPTEPFNPDDVTRLLTDETDGRLLGYIDRTDPLKPRFFDPVKQSAYAKAVRAFPGRRAEAVTWTPDFGKLVVHTSGNRDSGTWYLVDIAGKRADPIGYDRPTLDAAAVGPVSIVEYQAADGLAMNGVLTLPPGRDSKDLPVVIMPHDNPNSLDLAMFDWQAQAFASRGYAVFQPNYRGSRGLGETLRLAGKGQLGRKMQTDISDGLAELARRGLVDPKRACIVGIGYGGYAALAGVTVQHGLYRCAVAVAPVTDLGRFQNTSYREAGFDPTVIRWFRETLGPSEDFAAISPRKRAADADAPILLIHGKDDVCVPFSQSETMADALKDAGKPYELVVLREEDHWLSRPATRQQMLEAAVGFVETHNPVN
ncbi:MAG: alpha/beta fold hydrolase [Novosphingobium sp.]